jgi:hypothetical protein
MLKNLLKNCVNASKALKFAIDFVFLFKQCWSHEINGGNGHYQKRTWKAGQRTNNGRCGLVVLALTVNELRKELIVIDL